MHDVQTDLLTITPSAPVLAHQADHRLAARALLERCGSISGCPGAIGRAIGTVTHARATGKRGTLVTSAHVSERRAL